MSRQRALAPSRNDGKSFEALVATICGHYAARGILRARKVDPPTKTFGKGKIIHLENPFLDFVGTWTERSGRALFFECKSTSSHRLPFGAGGITDNQTESLRQWAYAGAVAFVLWEYKGLVKLIPQTVLGLALAKGARSIMWEAEEQGTQVLPGLGFIMYDFAAVMRNLWHD